MNATAIKHPSILGGILLVISNVIGAGILALPIAVAQLGLFNAVITLGSFWVFMMLGAYYFLEANLAFPSGSNLISMARNSLGSPGVLCAWGSNLLVMYSLIAAYIAGGSDLLAVNMSYLGFTFPRFLSPVLFVFIFGFIIWCGMRTTDYANRMLMGLKGMVFMLMLVALSVYLNPHTVTSSMFAVSQKISGSLLMVVLTSYGFATLLPSLRIYYHGDVIRLRKIVFLGTLIPFLCYVAWVTLIFAIIPVSGTNSFESIASSAHPLGELQQALHHVLPIQWIVQGMNLFSAICILTSFLANSVSLSDFIADGFKLYDQQQQRKFWVYILVYLPPLAAVLIYPQIFLFGLSIAGFLAIIQLLILPGTIVWFVRYKSEPNDNAYRVMGGKPLLMAFIIASVLMFIAAIIFR